jgi:hypothetical protein
MAKEKTEETREKKEGAGKKRLHLHRIVTEEAGDGTYVHHDTYKTHKHDVHEMPERRNAATSQNAEEAGQRVSEQFGMNEGQGGDQGMPQGGQDDTDATAQPQAGGEVMGGE